MFCATSVQVEREPGEYLAAAQPGQPLRASRDRVRALLACVNHGGSCQILPGRKETYSVVTLAKEQPQPHPFDVGAYLYQLDPEGFFQPEKDVDYKKLEGRARILLRWWIPSVRAELLATAGDRVTFE